MVGRVQEKVVPHHWFNWHEMWYYQFRKAAMNSSAILSIPALKVYREVFRWKHVPFGLVLMHLLTDKNVVEHQALYYFCVDSSFKISISLSEYAFDKCFF
jgi:hypothetical protein